MAANTRDVPSSVESGYELVRNLIFSQVHRFKRRHGGDFDDLVGEANLLFLQGHGQYVRGVTPTGRVVAGDYATSIRRWVWYGLFDKFRVQLARKAKAGFVPMEGCGPAGGPVFNTVDFIDSLTQDARRAAELVLDPPDAVIAAAEAKGGAPRNFRSTVRAHLRGEGWGTARINTAFEEIRRALG